MILQVFKNGKAMDELSNSLYSSIIKDEALDKLQKNIADSFLLPENKRPRDLGLMI